MVVGIVVGVCVAYVLAHLALIEVGREVVVVSEPTPTGGVRKARLWIVTREGMPGFTPATPTLGGGSST